MDWNTQGFAGPLAQACTRPATLRPPDDALPVAPASDRAMWGPGRALWGPNRGADGVAITAIVARAGAEAGTPWPQPLASAAARVHRDGDRDGYEQQVFARQRRLSRAAVAAAATLEDRFLDEVADGVQLLAEQSTWCWPAHDDAFARSGSVLASVAEPFLDLGAGEVVGQLAWIDHLLGAQLDERYPGLRTRIRLEADRRVFTPFLERRDWHWLGLDGHVHNWNPWIHGNVLVAALVLCDDDGDAPDGGDACNRRDGVVALAAQGLDRYVAALPADGAIDEGYAYWWNGACRALEALDLLSYATDGEWDAAAAVPALRETVAFPHRMHLGGPWYVNLADGPARPPAHQPWHALHRAALAVGDEDAKRHAAAHRRPGEPAATEDEGLGRLLLGITDRAWVGAGTRPEPLPRDVWLPSTQVLVARPCARSHAGLTVVAKGGHNGENHNHNDVGSVIVASDGVPVLVDAGRPTYTAQTFGPDRYDIWTMQSDWHNVPRIGGSAQRPGAGFAASGVAVEVSDAGSWLDLDLAGAYPDGVVDGGGWRRRAGLDRESGTVRIDDRWSGAGPGTAVTLLVAGEVVVSDGLARVTPLGGGRAVRISWAADAAAAVAVRELDDPMLSGVWGDRLTRMEIAVDDRESLRITVEQEPSEDERR